MKHNLLYTVYRKSLEGENFRVCSKTQAFAVKHLRLQLYYNLFKHVKKLLWVKVSRLSIKPRKQRKFSLSKDFLYTVQGYWAFKLVNVLFHFGN